eukprot:805587-Amphidinium_carterae.1
MIIVATVLSRKRKVKARSEGSIRPKSTQQMGKRAGYGLVLSPSKFLSECGWESYHLSKAARMVPIK